MSLTVSVAIPSLNQGEFLEDALKSLLSQSNVKTHIALVDGGSTDKTREIISLYRDKFDYVRSSPDDGQAAAINEGISRLPKAPYAGWLNADDLLLPHGLEAMASFLDVHPEYVAVFGKAHIINGKGQIIGEYPTQPFNKKTFAVCCTICQPASLIRRSAWEQVGELDESIETCLDYDLWWRLSKIGQLGYIDQFVACTRDHPNSKTRTQRKLVNDEAVSILLRHRGMVPVNWCVANILEGSESSHNRERLARKLRLTMLYIRINKWKALLPCNWLCYFRNQE
jgi:GT2 family glycosyltransferase